MTREEAIEICARVRTEPASVYSVPYFVDVLAALGVLKFDLPEISSVELAAIQVLRRRAVNVDAAYGAHGAQMMALLTEHAAREIVGILRKSGFKITRD